MRCAVARAMERNNVRELELSVDMNEAARRGDDGLKNNGVETKVNRPRRHAR